MNNEMHKRSLDLCEKPEGPRGYASSLFRIIWFTLGTALLVTLLFLTTHRTQLSETWSELLAAAIYCAAIVPPSFFSLNWVSHRYTDRFPRLVILFQALIQLTAATAGCFVAGIALQMAGLNPPNGYWNQLRSVLPFANVFALVIGLGISTFETLRFKLQAASLELQTRRTEQERANKLLAEARLSSLESRIHPHFLFNTLNSIAALIPSDPARAEQTVGNLASLLRFSLNANQSGLVPLAQELKILRDYLEIEKTRFGARLHYEINVPGALDQVKVPPLALQTLAENAVKHVVSRQTQGANIEITGSIHSNRVCLAVLDDGPGFTLNSVTAEHGLGSLIARMELLYGSAGQLEVSREDDKTAVRLYFPE
jgi:two-component system, LytTR family, sensor histidine kinase AlgZ